MINVFFVELQPIGSKLPYYYSKEEQFAKQREEDRAKWEEVAPILQSVMRKAVERAVANCQMNRSEAQKYFISGADDYSVFILLRYLTLTC